MKKMARISGLVFVSFLFMTQGLYAQSYDRYGPGIEEDYYGLNLTQEQMEKIEILELELEKEISPLIAKLRSNYVVLDELEAERNPDPKRIDAVWEVIYRLEEDIEKKEISHEKKIQELLTEDQRVIFDGYCGYGSNPYGGVAAGRGYFQRAFRGYRGRNYGYGGYGYGAGMGRNYLGRGMGRLGRGYYGYGQGVNRGYGRNMGYLSRGAGQLGLGYGRTRYYRSIRYGRGPCGAGLGRWYRWNDYRGGRNWRR
jgi:hypothetical protein